MTLEIKAMFALPWLIKGNSFSDMTEKKSSKINSVMHPISQFLFCFLNYCFFVFLVSLISLLLLEPASNATTQNKIILWWTSNDYFENRWFDGK